MYKYVLWDIDGTILDFAASEAYAIKTLFRKYGFGECSDEKLALYSDINRGYWQALERGEMTKPEILVGRFQEFFQAIGADETKAEAFNRDYQITLGDHVEFRPHALEELEREQSQYVLAAVTNGTKIAQERKLKAAGLNPLFDYVFISEDVGVEKPNVEFFDIVFETMGIQDKREVLIVGDSLTSDIKGGTNAGIDTCWYNPSHATFPTVSDNKTQTAETFEITYEIEDFIQLREILE